MFPDKKKQSSSLDLPLQAMLRGIQAEMKKHSLVAENI